jgi:hypothetical protein
MMIHRVRVVSVLVTRHYTHNTQCSVVDRIKTVGRPDRLEVKRIYYSVSQSGLKHGNHVRLKRRNVSQWKH